MLLRIKSIIYKYTGLYLARKEEWAYYLSREYQQEYNKCMAHTLTDPDDALDAEDVHGLLIGSWQAHHGFHRPMSFIQYKHPRWVFRIIGWFEVLFIVLKWDVKNLFGV